MGMKQKQATHKPGAKSPAQASKYLFLRDPLVDKFLDRFISEGKKGKRKENPRIKMLDAIATRSCRNGSPLMIADIMAKANLMMKGDEKMAQAVETEIKAQMGALQALTSAMLRYGYDTDSRLYKKFARDYRFLDTLLCYIKSEIEAARSIKKRADDEKKLINDTQQTRLKFINKFQERMSGTRLLTYGSSIFTAVGVSIRLAYNDLTNWIQRTFPNWPSVVVGLAIVVGVSAAGLATSALIDFGVMVNRNIVASRTRSKIRDVLEWEQKEIGKKLANVYIMAMSLATKFGYSDDVKREFPALANAASADDWVTVRRIIDSAIRAVSDAGKSPIYERFGDMWSHVLGKKPGCEATQHCGKCAEKKQAGSPAPAESPEACGKCLGEHALLQAQGYNAGTYVPPEEKKANIPLPAAVQVSGPVQ
jgi:hypothetical protein